MTDKFIVSRAEAVKRLSNRHAEACERFPYTREISLERYIKRNIRQVRIFDTLREYGNSPLT